MRFEVEFPANHWAAEPAYAQLEKLLPPRPAFHRPAGEHVEDVHLEDFDPSSQSRSVLKSAQGNAVGLDCVGLYVTIHMSLECSDVSNDTLWAGARRRPPTTSRSSRGRMMNPEMTRSDLSSPDRTPALFILNHRESMFIGILLIEM